MNKLRLTITAVCATITFVLYLLFFSESVAQIAPVHPVCQSASSDSDGDGFGWENNATCVVAASASITMPDSSADNCDYSDAHLHGGWGWDNVARQSCPPLEDSIASPAQTGELGLVDNGDILVLLVDGQSNATSELINYDHNQDAPVNDVFVWVAGNSWEQANLCTQVWYDAGFYPAANGNCNGNIGFQIAKNLKLKYPNNRIALIPSGVPGMALSCWDTGAQCWNQTQALVNEALGSIDGKSDVDFAAFLQGESDNGRSNWINELHGFIGRLRGTSWFRNDTRFIMSETHGFSINSQIRTLDRDGDFNTDWVSSDGLRSKDGTHWNAADTRRLGRQFAEKM